jgi:hypothetical protein
MSSRSTAGRRRAGVQPRLVVEALEQRCLPSFSAPIAVASTFNQAMAVGDFTGDGIADLATIRGSTLTVLPGNGDGTFQSPIATPGLPNGTHALATGRLTAGGNLDAVVTTRGFVSGDPNLVSLLFGNGDGTFQAPVNVALNVPPTSVTLADVRGNGLLDLVVTADSNFGATSAGTEILLNNGDGTFSPSVTLPITHSVVGHFSNDGNLDIAGISGNNSISVFLGNGDGTFQVPITSHVGRDGLEVVVKLAAGNFTRTGIQDIAATTFGDDGSNTTNRVYGLLAQGDGTFQENPASLNVLPYGAIPSFIAVADFYGDGISGLIEGDRISHDVAVLRSVGDGSFQLADSIHGVFVGGDLFGAVGDFNGDGLPDFAVSNGTSSPIEVFLNAGPASSGPTTATSTPARSNITGTPFSVTAGTPVNLIVAAPENFGNTLTSNSGTTMSNDEDPGLPLAQYSAADTSQQGTDATDDAGLSAPITVASEIGVRGLQVGSSTHED